VSLLSNKRVRLVVRPGAVEASLWRGWLRRVKVAEHRAEPDGDEPDAGGAAGMLADALAALALQSRLAGARLDAEVDDALVHFDVAHGEFAALSARQLRSVAVACVRELLGEAASSHDVRWQLQRDERHLFVCAMPTGLLDAIAAAAAAHRLRVHSIQPTFSVQWNRHAPPRAAGGAVFAASIDANATIACVRKGVITAVSSGPWCADRTLEDEGDFDHASVPPAPTGPFGRTLLDSRVDQLLASLGLDALAQSPFVLVSAEKPPSALSTRWTTLEPAGVGP
jgi:hypothetical protein